MNVMTSVVAGGRHEFRQPGVIVVVMFRVGAQEQTGDAARDPLRQQPDRQRRKPDNPPGRHQRRGEITAIHVVLELSDAVSIDVLRIERRLVKRRFLDGEKASRRFQGDHRT